MRSYGIGSAVVALTFLAAVSDSQEPPEPARELLGQGAAFRDAEERILAPVGAVVREQPTIESAITGRLDVATELVVRERRGEWTQVEFEGYLGWLLIGEGAADDTASALEEQIGRIRELTEERRQRVARERARHVRRRESAQELMPGARSEQLGPFVLWTELAADDSRLQKLRRLASSLEGLLLSRLGFEASPPRPTPLEQRLEEEGTLEGHDQMFLFSTEEQYRSYLDHEGDLAGFELGGHAQAGTAALFVRDLNEGAFFASFVHEAVHLSSFRLFGGRLPDWLEEGLSEDLAWSRLDADGNLQPGTFQKLGRRVVRTRRARTVHLWFPGQLSQICEAERRWQGSPPDPRTVSALDFAAFVDPQRRAESYTLAGLMTRALLSDDAEPVAAAAARLRIELRDRWNAERSEPIDVVIDGRLAERLAEHVESQLDALSGACGALRSRR